MKSKVMKRSPPRLGPRLIYSPHNLKHEVDDDCPEKPSRLSEVLDNLEAIAGSKKALERASYGRNYLELVHDSWYWQGVRELCSVLPEGEVVRFPDSDTCYSLGTYKAACHAVGGAVRAADLARYNIRSFAVVRPPGHHAKHNEPSGFCIYNNMAIAAEYLVQCKAKERVLVVDVDLHFGDGTFEYAQGRENIFYFSINHESIWPHKKPHDEKNTRTIFLPESTQDSEYISVLERELPSLIERVKPTIIGVSAGFDTMATDYQEFHDILGGGFLLTAKSYEALWEILNQSLIPYFAVLEGGYHPQSVYDGVDSFFKKWRLLQETEKSRNILI